MTAIEHYAADMGARTRNICEAPDSWFGLGATDTSYVAAGWKMDVDGNWIVFWCNPRGHTLVRRYRLLPRPSEWRNRAYIDALEPKLGRGRPDAAMNPNSELRNGLPRYDWGFCEVCGREHQPCTECGEAPRVDCVQTMGMFTATTCYDCEGR